MIVDDGFSVLDTDCGILGERKAVNEVKVVKVPIDHIFPNPYQPRKTFDDSSLEDLSASIAQYGVLQPLLVAPAENGKYLLPLAIQVHHAVCDGFHVCRFVNELQECLLS